MWPRRRVRRDLETEAAISAWRERDDGSWQRSSWFSDVPMLASVAVGVLIGLVFMAFPSAAESVARSLHMPGLRAPGQEPSVNGLGIGLLFAVFAFGGLPSVRRRRYRYWCAVAYFGQARSLPWWRRAMNMWQTSGIGSERTDHGRRLASATWLARKNLALRFIFNALAGLSFAGAVLWLAWIIGLVKAAAPMSAVEGSNEAYRDLLWNAAHSIPLLELTDTLHWARPTAFVDDRAASVIILLSKLAIFIPIIQGIVELVRFTDVDPAVSSSDPVVVAVTSGLNATRRGREFDWTAALAFAGRDLAEQGYRLHHDEIVRLLELPAARRRTTLDVTMPEPPLEQSAGR